MTHSVCVNVSFAFSYTLEDFNVNLVSVKNVNYNMNIDVQLYLYPNITGHALQNLKGIYFRHISCYCYLCQC